MVSERRVTAARPTISSEVRTFAVFMGPNTPNSGWDGVDQQQQHDMGRIFIKID